MKEKIEGFIYELEGRIEKLNLREEKYREMIRIIRSCEKHRTPAHLDLVLEAMRDTINNEQDI